MIENWEDLGLKDGAGVEKWGELIQEKLGLKIIDLQNAICEWMKQNAEELAQEFPNVAPMGDYGKLLEDNDGMAEFFKGEASHPEHWLLTGAKADHNLMQFQFDCKAVDDGESLKGFVYVSKSGKVRHAFAQNQD